MEPFITDLEECIKNRSINYINHIDFFLSSCKKDKPTTPCITTSAVTAISYTTATSGGTATDEGGTPIASRGVCWSTDANPTMANTFTIDGIGLGTFISNLTQLTPNTMYYVRAYTRGCLTKKKLCHAARGYELYYFHPSVICRDVACNVSTTVGLKIIKP